MTATDTAVVTPIRRTVPRPGYLPHRFADAGRVYDGIHADMARIEDQAACAYHAADGDPAAAHTLLTAAGCRLTLAQIERLFQLTETAATARDDGTPIDFHYAADDFADFLQHLALESRKAVSA